MTKDPGIMLDIGPLGVFVPVEHSGIPVCAICKVSLTNENESGQFILITSTLTQETCMDCWDEHGPKESCNCPNCGKPSEN